MYMVKKIYKYLILLTFSFNVMVYAQLDISKEIIVQIELLKSNDAQNRISALKKLTEIGDKLCIEAIISMLSDQNREVRGCAMNSILQIGEEAVPILVSNINTKHKMCIITLLGTMGSKASSASSALTDVLVNTESITLAQYALEALARTGSKDSSNLLALINFAKQKKFFIEKTKMGLVIYSMSADDKKLIDILISKLQIETDKYVVLCILDALRRMKIYIPEAIPTLLNILNSKDDEIRSSVVNVISSVGDNSKSIIEALLKTLGDADEDVRLSSAISLWQLGFKDYSLLFDTFAEALDYKDSWGKCYIIEILLILKDPRTRTILLKYINDEDEYVRDCIVQALDTLDKE